jgi:hypothetical protein
MMNQENGSSCPDSLLMSFIHSAQDLLNSNPAHDCSPNPLRAIPMLQLSRGPAQRSMQRVIQRLDKANLAYAMMGGLAVEAHGVRCTIKGVHVLLTAEGFAEFQDRWVPRYYESIPKWERRFLDRKNGVTLTVLVSGLNAGMGRPCPVRFPDPVRVREWIGRDYYVNLPTLIDLRLAARRFQGLADVVNLIRANSLNEDIAEHLHPSLRSDYLGCLEEIRREEAFIARNG